MAKKEEPNKGEARRSASDELESMKMIIEENIGIKMKVLDIIRKQRKERDETIFDKVVDKKKKKDKNKTS